MCLVKLKPVDLAIRNGNLPTESIVPANLPQYFRMAVTQIQSGKRRGNLKSKAEELKNDQIWRSG
jgi:hypothetical protein